MTLVSDGKAEFDFTKTKEGQRVTLVAGAYQLETLAEYELFLEKDRHYAAGTISEATEEQLVLDYTLPKEAQKLTDHCRTCSQLEILQLLPKLYWAFEERYDLRQPLLAPENFYVLGDRIIALHRGSTQKVAPFKADEAFRCQRFKALILYLLDPTNDYPQLVAGASAVRSHFAAELAELTTLEALESYLSQQILAAERVRKKTQRLVNKKLFMSLKWGTLIGGGLLVILAGTTAFLRFQTLPKQEQIITAQASFINANYTKTAKTLERYSSNTLPQSARYVLAASYVELDTLSTKQKQVVLKSLSQNSAPMQLNYWIELGRGNYQKALDLAQNIGDDEYILHAYTKLYTATKNEQTMTGAKKQQLLTKYRKQINKYLKKLGGTKDDFKTTQ